jgi:two-component system sensor histidine kinase/response regulator
MTEITRNFAIPAPEDTVVLVVDDILNNVQIVGSILGAAGYQIVPATNGEQALRYSKNPPPDLILLDVMMPEMDGFEVCRRLKESPETSSIPVIFLTAAVDAELVVQGLEAGAVDYVAKPFNSAELLARVRTHLELKFSRGILESAAQKLLELNNEKNEFLSIAAHDLKSPICNFIGLAEHMLTSPEPERGERKEICESILRESRRLLQLVQNLLNIDALERGHLKLQLEPFDLADTAQTVAQSFRARAEAKRQTVLFETGAAPCFVAADPMVTFQILDNLVSNALKFSPPGTTVRVKVFPSERDVTCQVQDEGPGLNAEDKSLLFKKFARLSAKPTGDESSTGLGLSIVKKLVHAMNGSVWCESEAGKGAKFSFKIPGAEAPV